MPRRVQKPLYRSRPPRAARARRPADRVPCRFEALDDPPGVYGVDPEDCDGGPRLVFTLQGGEDADDVRPRVLKDARNSGERAWSSRERDLDAAPRFVGAHEPHERPHYVRRGDDSHEAIVTHDRQASDLPLVHLHRRLFYRILGSGCHHLLRHLVGHPDALEGKCAVRVAEGGSRQPQVSVRDDAHQPPPFEDGEVTNPIPRHSASASSAVVSGLTVTTSFAIESRTSSISTSPEHHSRHPSSASPPAFKISIRKGQRLTPGRRHSKPATDKAGIKASCPNTSTNSSPMRPQRSCRRASPASTPCGGRSGVWGAASSSVKS